jgi:hypothetical protein
VTDTCDLQGSKRNKGRLYLSLLENEIKFYLVDNFLLVAFAKG